MILNQVAQDIAAYDGVGLHYNLAAEGIYRARQKFGDPLSQEYQPYIIAGLIAFDMQRMMGRAKYDPTAGGFAARLRVKLKEIGPVLAKILTSTALDQINLASYNRAISHAYDVLAASDAGGLNGKPAKSFHVGATKILHWLNPDLFIMVDQNVARAFRVHHGVRYRTTGMPGYGGSKYLECLKHAQNELRRQADMSHYAPELPLARLFDKVAFVEGVRLMGGPVEAEAEE